jgi:steroid 5-alpha reductase family enzyme
MAAKVTDNPGLLTILAITLGVTFAAFTVLWVISLKINDASIVDYYWGLGFPVVGLLEAMVVPLNGWGQIFLAVVTFWALRLAWHLIARHRRSTAEDARYAAMRAAGGPNFKRNSLFYIFWLQALILWLVASPVHVALLGAHQPPLQWLFWLGIAIFSIGMTIETVADAQLARFKRNPSNQGKLLTGGLFAWCRHPNYFGESVLWWGLGMAAYALSGSVLAFAGPAMLTGLLLKVSGVPMLDTLLRSRPGYDAWVATTPAFLPRVPGAGHAIPPSPPEKSH